MICGSAMSGHAQYAVLGIIVLLLGVWLLSGLRSIGPRAARR